VLAACAAVTPLARRSPPARSAPSPLAWRGSCPPPGAALSWLDVRTAVARCGHSVVARPPLAPPARRGRGAARLPAWRSAWPRALGVVRPLPGVAMAWRAPTSPRAPWSGAVPTWPDAARDSLAQAQLAAARCPSAAWPRRGAHVARHGPILRAASWRDSSCSRCSLCSACSCPGTACVRVGSAAPARPPAQPCAACLGATCPGVDPSVTTRRVRRTARAW
jgi:hypothetical protein